jgi:hypothetical protein
MMRCLYVLVLDSGTWRREGGWMCAQNLRKTRDAALSAHTQT